MGWSGIRVSHFGAAFGGVRKGGTAGWRCGSSASGALSDSFTTADYASKLMDVELLLDALHPKDGAGLSHSSR
jgi:hypothetical protein